MRKTIGCLLLLCLAGSPIQSPAQKTNGNAVEWPPPSPSAESLHVVLNLATSSESMRIGDAPVTLRVELRNNGTETFYASRDLGSTLNAPGYVVIEVTNEANVTRSLYELHAYLGLTAPFQWWLGIDPQHYYGTSLSLEPALYDAIKVPGTYKLTARYVSEGGTVPPSPEWSVPIHWAWKGEIKSNAIKFKILPARK